MKSPTTSSLCFSIVFGLLGLVSAPGAEILAYYAFEDDFVDTSGKTNDAEASQNADELSFVEGWRGQSLSINDPDAENNSGGSVDIPINANPSELPGVTFGGWVNVSEQFEFDGFMATDNGGWDRGISVGDNVGSTGFGIASGEAPTIGGEIVPGEWQYVVGTFDSVSNVATIYVGDSMAATQTVESASGSDLADVGEPVIELGRYNNQDFHGLVDDIFVFDEALDAHRIGAIRNLRQSTLDLTPEQTASLFVLFDGGLTGVINEVGWQPVSGLAADVPGAVAAVGDGNFSVVLDDSGNGMQSGTVEVDPDSDGDGLEDLWETVQFGNLEQTAEGDADEDGLTNLEEFTRGTQPTQADSDRDGLDDGAEVTTHMTDPLDIDSDDDGVSDGAELATGTDPNDPQSLPRPAAPEVLAYYDFEGSFDDLSGNDNEARPEMNPDEASFIDGLRGQGLDINDPDAEINSGASINIPVDVNPTEQPDVSFGGWVNVETFEFDGFMAIDNGGWDRGITVNAQESNAFGVASGAAPVNAGEITPGEWQYVVATFSDSENRARIYVGSAEAAVQTTETADTQDIGRSDGELEIELGRYDNQDLDAVVDDIFVFQGELTVYQANAVRNLRLSAIDYSPLEAAQLFDLFSAESSGTVGAFSWTPVEGLSIEPPGAVREAGTGFTVVLDELGNGMMSSAAPRFLISSISRDALTSATITWSTRSDVFYAVEMSRDLVSWEVLEEGIEPAEAELSYTDTAAAIATDPVRYYRVREQEPPALFADGFEDGAEGWTVGVIPDFTATGTTWEVGAPTDNGPGAAFEGMNVYGMDLDANYEDATGIYLRSPVIDLTGVGRSRLTFQYFLAAGDDEGGRLNILDVDGNPLVAGLKLYVGPDGNTADWTAESIRLPDLDASIILEFEFLSGADDDPINRAGWFIDDVLLD